MNLNEKLSPHFKLKEFVKSASVPGHIVKPTYYQKNQMFFFCSTVLEYIRSDVKDYFNLKGRQASIRINSGIRDKVIYNALKERGYNPSKTSDHFFQSRLNPIGRGAADITWPNVKIPNVSFNRFLKIAYEIIINKMDTVLNQCILYKNKDFIHVSMSPELSFFSGRVKRSRKRFFIKG